MKKKKTEGAIALGKKQFKAESKRLLDLMIHSIYTHKEIFLRELISNASDAIDKMYYKALTDNNHEFKQEDYFIKLTIDKENRELRITDTGIGMTKDEMEDNLGVIAKSGSLAFKKENELKDGYDIIGQFGVGFYSAFMVADKVTVISKSAGSDEAYLWQSTGADGYTIEASEKASTGTEIILKLKENTEDDHYDEFLQEYRLKSLIKKHSDFIRYPIKMDVTVSKPKEDNAEEFDSVTEEQTINSQVPIWRKNKNELTDEDYEKFYNEKHFGFDSPLKHLHISTDGTVRYQAILYIPRHVPFDYYTKEYEKGLQLYSGGVLIMDKCPDLLPDYFGFVKGLVDSEDLSLNISREMLQHDRQLQIIAKNIKNKIKSSLISLLTDEREKYLEFYKSFGRMLKFGIQSDYGMNKDVLQDLLLFYSSREKKLVTLDEYITGMLPDQKYIYYATGETIEKIDRLPKAELVKDKGYEILYFTEDVDEFAIKVLRSFKDKEFKSVSDKDLGIDDTVEKPEISDSEKELFEKMQRVLITKIKEVRISKRLKSYPVCLTNDGEISIEMEKTLKNMPNAGELKIDKILEINPDHEVFDVLKEIYKTDDEKLTLYTNLLYNQALLMEGLPVSDPVEFTNDICKLMK
ncbi:MAG: molecular chaperone HtpG [Clostridiales bacterium 43-6]|nr:MAG: molecular chaperone HtpG [Clostridiales bacterium 43-6]